MDVDENIQIVDAVIDVETTGFHPGKNEIIEVAAVVYDPVTMKAMPYEVDLYIKPQRPQNILQASMDLNKIDLDAIPEENTPEKMRLEFLCWIESLSTESRKVKIRPTGHNYATFDLPFLRDWLTPETYNEYFHHRVVDTCFFARIFKKSKIIKNLESCSLETLAAYYKIKKPPHKAVGDIYITLEVYKKLINELTPFKQFIRGLVQMLMEIPNSFGELCQFWLDRYRM